MFKEGICVHLWHMQWIYTRYNILLHELDFPLMFGGTCDLSFYADIVCEYIEIFDFWPDDCA